MTGISILAIILLSPRAKGNMLVKSTDKLRKEMICPLP